MAELDSSKSIRDKVARNLLDKYEANADSRIERYKNTKEEQLAKEEKRYKR